MRAPPKLLRFIVAGLLLAAAGCNNGPKLVPVEGTVTLDGKPLDGAVVSFNAAEPDLPSPIATTDEQGRFALDVRGKPGATPGKYKVLVSKTLALETAPVSAGKTRENAPAFKKHIAALELAKTSKQLVPGKYLDLEKTPLDVAVPPEGDKDLHLSLTSSDN